MTENENSLFGYKTPTYLCIVAVKILTQLLKLFVFQQYNIPKLISKTCSMSYLLRQDRDRAPRILEPEPYRAGLG